jgi:DNA-binding MarR family transcriptional regulator
LQKRTTAAADAALVEPDAGLDQQSTQLVGYLEALFRRLMLHRKQDDPELEISREEIRAMLLLDSGERLTMSHLAESLGVPLSTATHTVDRLVAKGLVERNRSEEDRRVVEVQMSQYGRTLQESFRGKRKLVARSWLEPLSDEERGVFLQLMAKITLLAKPGPEDAR